MWLKDDVPERRRGLSGGLAPLLSYAQIHTLRRMMPGSTFGFVAAAREPLPAGAILHREGAPHCPGSVLAVGRLAIMNMQ